jgi:hypothetical protein
MMMIISIMIMIIIIIISSSSSSSSSSSGGRRARRLAHAIATAEKLGQSLVGGVRPHPLGIKGVEWVLASASAAAAAAAAATAPLPRKEFAESRSDENAVTLEDGPTHAPLCAAMQAE